MLKHYTSTEPVSILTKRILCITFLLILLICDFKRYDHLKITDYNLRGILIGVLSKS